MATVPQVPRSCYLCRQPAASGPLLLAWPTCSWWEIPAVGKQVLVPLCLRNQDLPANSPVCSLDPGREPTKVRAEKNHVVPPSSLDEVLSRYSVSGEVPR